MMIRLHPKVSPRSRFSLLVLTGLVGLLLPACQSWRDMNQSSWIGYTETSAGEPIAYSIAKDGSDYVGEYFILDPAHPQDLGKARKRVPMIDPLYKNSGTTFTAGFDREGSIGQIHLVYDTYEHLPEGDEVYAIDKINDREVTFRKGVAP